MTNEQEEENLEEDVSQKLSDVKNKIGDVQKTEDKVEDDLKKEIGQLQNHEDAEKIAEEEERDVKAVSNAEEEILAAVDEMIQAAEEMATEEGDLNKDIRVAKKEFKDAREKIQKYWEDLQEGHNPNTEMLLEAAKEYADLGQKLYSDTRHFKRMDKEQESLIRETETLLQEVQRLKSGVDETYKISNYTESLAEHQHNLEALKEAKTEENQEKQLEAGLEEIESRFEKLEEIERVEIEDGEENLAEINSVFDHEMEIWKLLRKILKKDKYLHEQEPEVYEQVEQALNQVDEQLLGEQLSEVQKDWEKEENQFAQIKSETASFASSLGRSAARGGFLAGKVGLIGAIAILVILTTVGVIFAGGL